MFRAASCARALIYACCSEFVRVLQFACLNFRQRIQLASTNLHHCQITQVRLHFRACRLRAGLRQDVLASILSGCVKLFWCMRQFLQVPQFVPGAIRAVLQNRDPRTDQITHNWLA